MTEEIAQTTPVVQTPTVESSAVQAPIAIEASAPVVTEVAPVVETTVLGAEAIAETPVEVKTDAEAKVEEVKTEPKVENQPDAKPTEKAVEPVKKNDDGAEKQPEVKDKEEASKSDEPAPLPSLDPWKFPEGVQVDEARVGEFSKELAEFARDTKVDAKLVHGLGQKLIDRHVSEVQAVAQQVAEAYDKVWKDQTKSWFEQFKKDPEIGGDKADATTAAAREFIRKHGGTPEQQVEIRTLMQKTGLGNHPAVIRLFAKANSNLAEGKMVPAGKPPSAPQTMKQKLYGKKS